MQAIQLTNQVNTKQGYLCLLLLLVALLFSSLASLKMTLSMFPQQTGFSEQINTDTIHMVHGDAQEHQHCHNDQAADCQVSQSGHDHQGCSQAHCSTLPVLATPFNLTAVALAVESQELATPQMRTGEPSTPYIPPIA